MSARGWMTLMLVLAGAGCSSSQQPTAPPDQTEKQSSAVTTSSCPEIEVEPSGHSTQRFALGDTSLKVTVDSRAEEASSRIELDHRFFSESKSHAAAFERDGLAIELRFGKDFYGDNHEIRLFEDGSTTFGTVDGRPITPLTSDDQQVTFLNHRA